MGMEIGGASEYNSEINVTPMVDVMLVLLIIFMIVTPLLQSGVSVNLPRDMISPDPDEEIAKDTRVVSAQAASHGATFLGTLALVLASVGIYGVMAWSVVQRTREIGIRMALCAQSYNVLALVLRQGMKLVLLGIAIGVPASVAAAQLLKSMMFGLSAVDALTIGSVTTLLVGVTLLACYLPARRATRLDPMVTLRDE